MAEKIDRDFTDGLAELAEWDPVRTEGRLNGSATGSVRYRSRHLRLNYFALKALRRVWPFTSATGSWRDNWPGR